MILTRPNVFLFLFRLLEIFSVASRDRSFESSSCIKSSSSSDVDELNDWQRVWLFVSSIWEFDADITVILFESTFVYQLLEKKKSHDYNRVCFWHSDSWEYMKNTKK